PCLRRDPSSSPSPQPHAQAYCPRRARRARWSRLDRGRDATPLRPAEAGGAWSGRAPGAAAPGAPVKRSGGGRELEVALELLERIRLEPVHALARDAELLADRLERS